MTPASQGVAGLRGETALLRFAEFVADWLAHRPDESIPALVERSGGAGRVAVFVVDMVRAFCDTGPLASPRVAALAEPIARFFERARAHGIEAIHLVCDCHDPDAAEFEAFPPHSVRGTEQAEVVPTIRDLPGAAAFQVVRKNALSALHAPDWRGVDWTGRAAAVVVGNCTDLCVYQLAMGLKLAANQDNRKLDVVVPARLVQTYDTPLEIARREGLLAHPGDLFHSFFLYHMGLNGIRVVADLAG